MMKIKAPYIKYIQKERENNERCAILTKLNKFKRGHVKTPMHEKLLSAAKRFFND